MIENIVRFTVILLVILNFIHTFKLRQQLKPKRKLLVNDVPTKFKKEVGVQLQDGYELLSIHNDVVRLVKRKVNVFPWILSLPFLNSVNLIFTSSFLCNIYGIELIEVNNEIELSTF